MYKKITRMLPRITRTKKFCASNPGSKILLLVCEPTELRHVGTWFVHFDVYNLCTSCHKNLVNSQTSLCTLYRNIAIFCVRCAQVFSINKYYFTTLWIMCELVVKTPKSGTLFYSFVNSHRRWGSGFARMAASTYQSHVWPESYLPEYFRKCWHVYHGH